MKMVLTILGTNSVNSANEPLCNKQTIKQTNFDSDLKKEDLNL